jgi:aryl-alcohol dehydrogenase
MASIDMLTLLPGRTPEGILEGNSNPQSFVPKMIEMYQTGQFPFDTLIRLYRFDQINQAIRRHDIRQGRQVGPTYGVIP